MRRKMPQSADRPPRTMDADRAAALLDRIGPPAMNSSIAASSSESNGHCV
ncbi:hypothetical protein [Paraburkholderia metrosideri]|nr:hypothetical protein [Paraburkholderia metrosideri]